MVEFGKDLGSVEDLIVLACEMSPKLKVYSGLGLCFFRDGLRGQIFFAFFFFFLSKKFDIVLR